jgi:hypothetical protein
LKIYNIGFGFLHLRSFEIKLKFTVLHVFLETALDLAVSTNQFLEAALDLAALSRDASKKGTFVEAAKNSSCL